MKNTLILLILSILYILIPSLFIALGFYIFTEHFLAPLLFTIGLVYIIGLFSNKYYEHSINIINENIKTKLLEQSLEIHCAYCKTKHVIPIRIDKRNTFECKSCNKTSLIVFQFTSAQLTEPLTVSEISIPVKEIEETNNVK